MLRNTVETNVYSSIFFPQLAWRLWYEVIGFIQYVCNGALRNDSFRFVHMCPSKSFVQMFCVSLGESWLQFINRVVCGCKVRDPGLAFMFEYKQHILPLDAAQCSLAPQSQCVSQLCQPELMTRPWEWTGEDVDQQVKGAVARPDSTRCPTFETELNWRLDGEWES